MNKANKWIVTKDFYDEEAKKLIPREIIENLSKEEYEDFIKKLYKNNLSKGNFLHK